MVLSQEGILQQVDRNIQLYFKHYNEVTGFKYNKDHILTIVNNQIVDTSVTNRTESVTNRTEQNPSFPIGPEHFRVEVNEYQTWVDNSVEIRSKYEYLMNLSEDELAAYLSDDDLSTSTDLPDSKVNDPGNHRHVSNTGHEISDNDIAVMIMNIMKEMNPNADDDDLVVMSNAIENDIRNKEAVNGLLNIFKVYNNMLYNYNNIGMK